MKKSSLVLYFLLLLCGKSLAQSITISPSGITPAMGGNYPRLSYDAIMALPSPAAGDIAFDTTFLCLRVYNRAKWLCTYQNPADPTPNIAAIITAGGNSLVVGQALVLDATGNIYVTGYFAGTANFGGTPKTSAGNFDIFIAKYNSAGALLWVQTAGGTNNDEAGSIAIDASGNSYIAGSFQGTASFGAISKKSEGSADVFVAKYNSAGTLLWVQTAGGIDYDQATSIALDPNGNSYITGSFNGTARFGATSKKSEGGSDIFIAKYNTAGTLQWAQAAGGTNNDFAQGIAIDPNGNSYITGSFNGTARFGNNIRVSTGGSDIFIAQYNTAGTIRWVDTAGGINNDFARGVAIDANGNRYITGTFRETARFGTSTRYSEGSTDVFIAKYNSLGSFQWVQTAGGSNIDQTQSITIDALGNSYITGIFEGTAHFGNTSKTSAGINDIFIAKYNPEGSVLWVQTAGGESNDQAQAQGVAIDLRGNIYIIGSFIGTSNFGATSKTASGELDMFVVKVQQ